MDADAMARETWQQILDIGWGEPFADPARRVIAAALRRAHDAGLERAAREVTEMAYGENVARSNAAAQNNRRHAERHADQEGILRDAAAAIRALKEAPHD